MTYEGQPEYVRVGFMVDLLHPWCNIEGSEWGAMLGVFHDAAEASLTCGDESRAELLVKWILEELDAAEWWGDYESAIKAARRETPATIEHWRERAVSFKGEAALEEVIVSLPEWIMFDAERDAPDVRDDPEYKTYERLKRKFE